MLHYMQSLIRTRIKSERGATAVEYGLLVALIAVAIIVVVSTLGKNLSGMFEGVSDKIGTKPSAPTT